MMSYFRAICATAMLCLAFLGGTAAQAQYWQCAPFAREFSGVQLFGRAAGWWEQAAGKYERGSKPVEGAVMVFKATGSMRAGHVATVSKVVDSRTLRITHANWSVINGTRGQIERDVTVIDASPNNDWSRVRVWYASLKGIGTTAYPLYGFIYKGGAPADTAPNLEFAALDIQG